MEACKLVPRVTVPAVPPKTAVLVPAADVSVQRTSAVPLYQVAEVRFQVPAPPEPPVRPGSQVNCAPALRTPPASARLAARIRFMDACFLGFWVVKERWVDLDRLGSAKQN